MNDTPVVARGNSFIQQLKFIGAQQANKLMVASDGTITSIDTQNGQYVAKVMLQPLAIETGWLPIGTGYAGNGFGFVVSPDIGTEVTVLFSLGNLNCGKIICFNFNNIDVAPVDGINQGDAFFIHKSGSYAKLLADGTIEVSSPTQITQQCPSIDLGDTGGAGVVTGECICPYTGNPHPDVSSVVRATK